MCDYPLSRADPSSKVGPPSIFSEFHWGSLLRFFIQYNQYHDSHADIMKRSFTRSEVAAVPADIELLRIMDTFLDIPPPVRPEKMWTRGQSLEFTWRNVNNFEESQWNLLRYMLRKKVLYTVY